MRRTVAAIGMLALSAVLGFLGACNRNQTANPTTQKAEAPQQDPAKMSDAEYRTAQIGVLNAIADKLNGVADSQQNLEQKTNRGFTRMDAGFAAVNKRLDEQAARMDRFEKCMKCGGGTKPAAHRPAAPAKKKAAPAKAEVPPPAQPACAEEMKRLTKIVEEDNKALRTMQNARPAPEPVKTVQTTASTQTHQTTKKRGFWGRLFHGGGETHADCSANCRS